MQHPTPWRGWVEDLERRESKYLAGRQEPSPLPPEARFTLSQEDAAFLGRIDMAFLTPEWMRRKT